MTMHDIEGFEQLFRDSEDPWRFRTRWYEQRKRALILACLPAERFRLVFEPGCANGELSADLASRSDLLISSDGAPAAVALARKRLQGWQNVEVRQLWLPDAWPPERFDLIVLSEFLYYLDRESLLTLVHHARSSLTENGTLIACHWRAPIEGCVLDGDQVHDLLTAHLPWRRATAVQDADFRIDVWSVSDRWVAEKEGLR